ncbi:hypothetical protein OC846_002305 [Tilletia horrida]|uniref:Uncharacterized protein n=1 Tax=Tilletia horrida TaxID=155126 RepID=A0AAN6JT20_9BASI|nr:hypothetical protein OC846_002305 [Tilletia horrida]KAK0567459.1 hypothetical protein OC861_002682 [Tilletia horrida]
MSSAALPAFSAWAGTPGTKEGGLGGSGTFGRSSSVSGPSSSRSASPVIAASSPEPFNFAGSPSLSNRPLEAAKHQHHRSRSINMGGFSPVMKGGKLINFGSGGGVSITGTVESAFNGEGSPSSGSSSSSNPGSPLSSSPAGSGLDPSALGPGFSSSLSAHSQIGSTAPRAPSPLQQSHTISPRQGPHSLLTDSDSNSANTSKSMSSPTSAAAFSSSPSNPSTGFHSHRDSRTIDFATAAKGWESPVSTPTTLPLPIPIGQYSLSSLRAAAATSDRARSPKPLSLGESQITATALGSGESSADHSAAGGSIATGSASQALLRRASGTLGKHASTTSAHSSAGSSLLPGSTVPRPHSPLSNTWSGPAHTASPGTSPSTSYGARMHRPTSPNSRGVGASGVLSRGRTPSPSRVREAANMSRGASVSPPLEADSHIVRAAARPASPANWDSSWPELGGSGARAATGMGLSSSPHNRMGGVRLERNFSNGSSTSSNGSPGTSPVTSSAPTGLGIASGSAWRFPSSPRGGTKQKLSPMMRPTRSSASSSSRSRSPSPSASTGLRSKSSDGDLGNLRVKPSSPIAFRPNGDNGGNGSHADARELASSRHRSSSSSGSSDGSASGEEAIRPFRPVARHSHVRTVSVDSGNTQGGEASEQQPRAKNGHKHGRKSSDPIPSMLKSPLAMRIAHGSAKAELDARQALSEHTKGKAGIVGGLIADEVDAFSEQLPPPAILTRLPSDGGSSMAVDETDPLARPASSASPHSASTLSGASASLNQLVRPTPVDARLLPPFGSSPLARTGSGGGSPANVLGLGSDSLTVGLHSPHSPFSTQLPGSPRLGSAPLPLSDKALLGLRSRSPSPFDPLRRQSPSPSPLANSLDAASGESPPKMRSFIGMPPRSGYDLSDDPDDVGSEGGSSASSADGREGSIGGGLEDEMDERDGDDDDEHVEESQLPHGDSQDSASDSESGSSSAGRLGLLRGLPSDISRSTLFARRHASFSGSGEDDAESEVNGESDQDDDDKDGREQRRGLRESRAPSPPSGRSSSTSPSRPVIQRKPNLTRSNVVPPPPIFSGPEEELEEDLGDGMKSVLGFFHGEDPESQLGDSAGWGAPLSRQVNNATRELLTSSQEDNEEGAEHADSEKGGDWVMSSDQEASGDAEDQASDPEEALTTLERIFLFAKSEMTYHRILVSQCLAEWILDVKLSDAVEYIIPLLNGLSTDEREVCEAFSPELHRIMWFFFRNCPIKQVAAAEEEDNTANGSTHANGSAQENAMRPQLDISTFTPLLCALLLNQNTGIARSTQNAIVQFCSRLHRDSEGVLLSENGSWSDDFLDRCEGDETFLTSTTVNRDGDDIPYDPYSFGPRARQAVEQEILHNVAIAIGSQNAHQPTEESKMLSGEEGADAAKDTDKAEESASSDSATVEDKLAVKQNGAAPPEGGEQSRDDSSWDPESQMDSQMEDVWRSDTGLFDASSPQLGPYTRGEFDEEAAVARMAGVSMLAALAAEEILHIDIITKEFVPQMVSLQADPAFFVRKEVAVSLGILAKAVTDAEVIRDSLLPTLDAHLRDNIWHVRQAACLSMPAVLSKTDDETQRSRAVSYLRLLANDVSRNVRSAALEIIGELVFLFHTKQGGVPDELVRFFLGEPIDGTDAEMAESSKENETGSQSRYESSNVTSSEYGFVDAFQMNPETAWGGGMGICSQADVHERAVVTAFNFPAVVYTMGGEHWARLQPLHTKLASDDAVKVRRSLASSLHEIAKLIGSENTQAHLLPLFDRFLQDHENEIKTAVLENVDVFLANLPLKDALAELLLMRARWTNSFARDWRLREKLAQHISVMADMFLLSDEDANLIALMQLAIADPVSAVRDAGILSIDKIYTIFSEHDQAAADGFLALVDELGSSSSYRIRVASLMAIEVLIRGTIQRAALETILLERLVEAAEDDVIDVRIVLARCVAAMCQKDELYGLPQSRSPSLLQLIEKLARDVSAEVRLPIQLLLLSEEEAQVAEKDAQENISKAPKSSTRTLVLGPKDGGPHREPRTSNFSAMSLDAASDTDIEDELQAFAMDEDVSEESGARRSGLPHQDQDQGADKAGGGGGGGDNADLSKDGTQPQFGGHGSAEAGHDQVTSMDLGEGTVTGS